MIEKNDITARIQVGKKVTVDQRSYKLTITVTTNEILLYNTLIRPVTLFVQI